MSAWRSRSLLFFVMVTYSSTALLFSVVVKASTNSCSGAKVTNDTPKMVSGRVVKTSIVSPLVLTPTLSKGEGAIAANSSLIFSNTKSKLFFTSSFVNLITLNPFKLSTIVLALSSSCCSLLLWYSPSISTIKCCSKHTKSAINLSIGCCLLNLASNFLLRKACQIISSVSV